MPARPTIGAAVAVATVSVILAGCGGSSKPTAITAANGTVAYAHCIRSHGIPNFPDPGGNGEIPKDMIPEGNPRLPAAQNACRGLMPAGGLGPEETVAQRRTRLADELSFARCIRSHGVSRFPDPTAQSELTVAMVQARGIDVHSPAVLRVVQTCVPASHGALTLAGVREALSQAGG